MQELTLLNSNYDITKAHTACYDCIFAKWYDSIQIGCEAQVLDKLAKKNILPTQVYNGDKEFFVIDGLKCSSKRDLDWAKNVNQGLKEALSNDTLLKIVNQQNVCKFYIMIYVGNPTHSFYDVERSIQECLKNTYEHVKYVFVCRKDRHNDTLQTLRNSKLTNWRIETIVEDCDISRAIDIAQKKSAGYQYSAVYLAGSLINFSLLNKINDKVQNLDNVACVLDGESFIFYNKIFTMLGGNFDKNFVEKLKMVIKETKEEHLLKNGDEL